MTGTAYTKGEWKKLIIGEKAESLVITTETDVICEVYNLPREALGNAHLIAAAVNACIKVNPDNPIAVAEALPELSEALKFLASKVSIMGVFRPETQKWIEQVLAKARGE